MILLDTHAWIWWAAEPERLSKRARTEVNEAKALYVAAISVWEVAMLVTKKRLVLDRETLVWAKQALALPKISLVPLSPEISIASASLGERFHGDPADRMIVATAMELRVPVVTKDERIRSFKGIEAIW